MSKSLELHFQVNAKRYLKFWGGMLTFVAGIAVMIRFAFLSSIIPVSVQLSELAVNWRGGWRSPPTVYCGKTALQCESVCDGENLKNEVRGKNYIYIYIYLKIQTQTCSVGNREKKDGINYKGGQTDTRKWEITWRKWSEIDKNGWKKEKTPSVCVLSSWTSLCLSVPGSLCQQFSLLYMLRTSEILPSSR